MKAIVGLGNPGRAYARTRHNAGFWVIDRLEEVLSGGRDPAVRRRAGRKASQPAKRLSKSVGIVTQWADCELLLVKPQTYMNESGLAVRELVEAYRVPVDHLLICVDELALPPGTIRLRAKGSAGGHNGMRSIINYLGTQEFSRLRIGIGSVPPGVRGADYVLDAPSPVEKEAIRAACDAAASAALLWAEEGIEAAMSRYNGNVIEHPRP